MTDFHMDGTKQGNELPTAERSELLIEQYAPAAISRLQELHATDLIDALGLRPYMKG